MNCKRNKRRVVPVNAHIHQRSLGLRREAQRHAAFARTRWVENLGVCRPHESGVAAPALPPQSKTLPRGLKPETFLC